MYVREGAAIFLLNAIRGLPFNPIGGSSSFAFRGVGEDAGLNGERT